MNVTPPTPPGGPHGPPPGQEPEYQTPPTQEFPKNLQQQPPPSEDEEQPTSSTDKSKQPKKKKKKEKIGQKQAPTPMQTAMGAGAKGLESGAITGAGAGGKGGASSAVDRIIQVFQDNQFFGAHGVSKIQVSEHGAETIIGVSLENGVEVNVNLAPGGQELNITLMGLSASAQALADNPQAQLALAQKLAEAGFIVHQIQTYRAEGPPPVAPPTMPAPPEAAGPQAGGGEREPGGEGEGGEPGEGGEEEGR